MAIFRNVHLSFWTDAKVVDDFTPEDRYFYLYLMTNPHTSLCGCYEVSIRQIASETGYSKDVIERLLNRMESTHDVIKYDKGTKEVLILNWGKYNWTKSPKFIKPLLAEIELVKNADFKAFLMKSLYGMDTVSIPYGYGSDTTDTDTVTVSDNNSISDMETIKKIIDYLNSKSSKNYKATSEKTKKLIRARLNDGFTEEDFKRVIDNKVSEWVNDPRMNPYLRPETLFGTKFESYLNQKVVETQKSRQDDWDEWIARKERERNERK